MKVTVHLEGNNRAELLKGLKAHIALLDGGTETTPTATTKTAETKKAGKAAPAETEEDEDFDLEVSGDDETDETESDEADADTEEETETEDEDDAPKIQLADLLSACSKAAKKHSTEHVKKLLKKKFGVTSPRDLKAAQYPKALAALKQ